MFVGGGVVFILGGFIDVDVVGVLVVVFGS